MSATPPTTGPVPMERIGFLGPAGTFTEMALQRRPEAATARAVPYPTVDAALDAVRAGEVDGAVVAIGNAPTALFHLLNRLAEWDVRPALVVGIPVGFIGAVESKVALANNDLGLEYVVVHGRRGGSAITCGALNAIASTEE